MKIRMTENFEIVIIMIYLSVTWIKTCPLPCQCFKRIRLTNCERKNLHKVPLGVPIYTSLLVLSHNNISTIQAHDFKELPNLRHLFIAKSSLSFFDTEVIKKFKKLTVLDLNGNLLTGIDKFPHHVKLNSLELQDNLLTDIGRTTFSLLWNISFLDLANTFQLILSNI